MDIEDKPFKVVFYKTENGKEPVREWLQTLTKPERKSIGEDIKTCQWGWPLGMPIVKKMDKDIWEVRSKLKNKISRVFLTKLGNNLVLLHGFIKKTQKTPLNEMNLARERLRKLK